jgi:Glyoxalase/Bleomycin resistance protein/Dioxygenase superfamily
MALQHPPRWLALRVRLLPREARHELRCDAVDMQPKLDHCVIHISNWERSNAFYREVLGAELVDRGSGTWAYRFGGEQLNVHGPGVRPKAERTAGWMVRVPAFGMGGLDTAGRLLCRFRW